MTKMAITKMIAKSLIQHDLHRGWGGQALYMVVDGTSLYSTTYIVVGVVKLVICGIGGVLCGCAACSCGGRDFRNFKVDDFILIILSL